MLALASMFRRRVLVASLFAVAACSEEEATKQDDNSTRPYSPPTVEGLHWVETFDGDALSRWKASSKDKYNSKFKVDKRQKESLIGDVGLLVPEEAKHYGISSKFPALTGKKDVPLVIQFEVQFQEGLQCGGSYVKVFDSKEHKAEDFDDSQQYIIMFGPDRCGGTDKVHFILQHQNPKTGKWEEKHLKDAPRVPSDRMTHLYGLIINPDNTFEVQIDGENKASGDLLTAMDPPINPPKEIDDPADSKPGDWIDDPQIDDPAVSKPDDWDENEPRSIPDPAATMPEGWREDITDLKIPDPSVSIPNDWDDEEDGVWEAPQIDNPDCKVGCGKWKAPTISNPKYKGKWHAPRVDNPAYKGVWGPRQIANPDYFEDKTPCVLPKIDSVGIDIWTMQNGIMFDNFVIDTDVARVKDFTAQTWKVRSGIEEIQKPKADASDEGIMGTISKYSIPIGVGSIVLIAVLVFVCFCRGESDVPPPRPKPVKKRDASPNPAQGQDPQEEKEDDDAKDKKADEKKED